MKLLVLVRHGETEWNHDNRVQGSMDVPLSSRGRAQAEALAQELLRRREAYDRIYTSDLKRAGETARILATRLGGPEVAVDPLLREMDCGRWEGLSIDDLREREPEGWRRWMDDPAFRVPGGESILDVRERARAFLESRREELRGAERVLVVAHGLLNRMILSEIMAIEPQRARFFATDNASFARFRWSRGRVFCDGWNVGCPEAEASGPPEG
jgi:broad specificity phosphatase PhoE